MNSFNPRFKRITKTVFFLLILIGIAFGLMSGGRVSVVTEAQEAPADHAPMPPMIGPGIRERMGRGETLRNFTRSSADPIRQVDAIDFSDLIRPVPISHELTAASSTSVPSPITGPEGSPCAVHPPNLQAWFSMNHAGGLILSDAPADEVLRGFTFPENTFSTQSKVGQFALTLDGANTFADVGDRPSISPTGAITIDLWVNPTTLGQQSAFVAKGDSPNGRSFFLGTDSTGTRVEFAVYQTGTASGPQRRVRTINSVLTTGIYQHVAATFDTSTQIMNIYVNGVSQPTNTVNADNVTSIFDTVQALFFGTFVDDSGLFVENYVGLLDEVHLFSRALSHSEINGIFLADNAGLCQTAGRLGYLFSSFSYEGVSTEFTFEVARLGGSVGNVSVNYGTAGTGGATAGQDFLPTSGVFNWSAGDQTIKTFTVNLLDDAINENDEFIAVNISSPSGGASLGTFPNSSVFFVDDEPKGTVSINSVAQLEGNVDNTVTFTVTLNRTNPGTVPMFSSFVNQTALRFSDYDSVGFFQSLQLGSTDTTRTFLVKIIGDTIPEPDETFFLDLRHSFPSRPNVTFNEPRGIGTIINDDSPASQVSVVVSPEAVPEDGPQNLLYTFSRSGPTDNPLTINVSLAGSTAAATDYSLSGPISLAGSTAAAAADGSINSAENSGSVTFPANSSTAVITVNPTADNVDEPQELVIFSIASGAGYSAGAPSSALGTIIDDDEPLTVGVAVAPLSTDEDGAGNLIYTFSRTTLAMGALTINYALSGTATRPADLAADFACSAGTGATAVACTGSTGSVTFNSTSLTARLIVDPRSDTVEEGDETVTVALTAGTGFTLSSQRTATGTILNDDFNPCAPTPVAFGESLSRNWNAQSCVSDGRATDVFSFNGTAGEQIVMTLASPSSPTRIQLTGPTGSPVGSTPFGPQTTSRLPATGFLTLPSTGVYNIRTQGFGLTAPGVEGLDAASYTFSLFRQPTQQPCSYLIAPASTEVPPAGGTFSFDVTTAPGCPPLDAPASSGPLHNVVSYVGGRLTFTVPENTGVERSGTIAFGDLSHTIRQFRAGPPANDEFANAQQISGTSNPAGMIGTQTSNGVPVTGLNTTASQQIIAGEPIPVPNTLTPAKSIWYKWFAPDASLYSFSTSGSNFDTVMAIYICPETGICSLTNMERIASNDDTTSFDRSSKVNFRAIAGRDYRIVIDGKNGASGTTQLFWMRYRRLFRVYLQTRNGVPARTTPTAVRAISGNSIVNGNRISQGVYEFNIPNDDLRYNVDISGPAGIIWNPNGYPLEGSQVQAAGEGVRCVGDEGGQYSVSNPECADGCEVIGWIRDIATSELPVGLEPPRTCPTGQNCLQVRVGYSSVPGPDGVPSTSHGDSRSCEIERDARMGFGFGKYVCPSSPEAFQDIQPSLFGKVFAARPNMQQVFTNPIYRYGKVIMKSDTDGTVLDPRFVATPTPTYKISGTVNIPGCTDVELKYTPIPGEPDLIVRGKTDVDGTYQFRNLAPRRPNLEPLTYSVKAVKQNVMFDSPPPVLLDDRDVTVNISSPSACTFEPGPSGIPAISAAGGKLTLDLVANSSTCDIRVSSLTPFITVDAGDIRGSGTINLSADPNMTGVARTGSIRIAGRPSPIVFTQPAGFEPGIEGDLAGRPNGNGTLTAADSQQFKAFVAGFDRFTPEGNNEYQRADVAPKALSGNGRLDAADQQQIDNYIAALDPQQPGSGPLEPTQDPPAGSGPETGGRVYRLTATRPDRSGYINATVELDALGNETAMTFSITFDPEKLAIDNAGGTDTNRDVTLASGAPDGTSITVNAVHLRRGAIGVLVDAGRAISAGTQRLVNFRFRVLKGAEPGTTGLRFSDDSLDRSTTNPKAESLGARYEDTDLAVSAFDGVDRQGELASGKASIFSRTFVLGLTAERRGLWTAYVEEMH